MNTKWIRLCLLIATLLCIGSIAEAQEISGISSIGYVRQYFAGRYSLVLQAYADTEEDYTASLYYDVQSTSASYFDGSPTPLATGTLTGNPHAAFSMSTPSVNLPGSQASISWPSGVYSEVTNHAVDCFFVVSLGEYYDPYGYSLTGEPNGDYNSGWWYSVDVYGAYIAEASIVLGQDFDASNDPTKDYQGQAVETVLYQAFIPVDNVPGPPAANCSSVVYAGDNRGFSPNLKSFRAMQQISVGIGGYTLINPSNAPPAEATGWTYQFASSALQNGVIPQTAYNFDYLGQCLSSGVNAYAHAPTTTMPEPSVSYNGGNDTAATLQGAAYIPVPLWSFPIVWNNYVVLSEPNPTTLSVGGSYEFTCYPQHELSVGFHDVAQWAPTYNTLPYISACLAGGLSVKSGGISSTIPLVPYSDKL